MISKTKLLKKALSAEEQKYAWNRYQDDVYDPDIKEYIYPPKPEHLVIIYDHYVYEDYSGSGHIIGYNKDTKQFFEVYGSHCSCYGLEGQWEEEYTTLEEIAVHTTKQLKALEESDYKWSSDEESLKRLKEIKELLELK